MILPKNEMKTLLLLHVYRSLQCQILEKTAIQYFKTERVVSLKISLPGESFITDPFYCPFFKH